ncbi:ATP-binding protein [Nannocystis pusilla]|uniref:ATP-binding protein n=1 Tax=Nannocystis pusilla TaxID=889268 RepID=UPI003B7EE3A2
MPPDLDGLCAALLEPDPKDRPDGAAIVARLGAAGPAEGALAPVPLFGRDDERQALTAAIAATVAGAPGFVRVRGASGVGKTRLVREVLEALEAPARPGCWPGAATSASRCPTAASTRRSTP